MKIPELLAPAGSYEGMVSAVQSGADAVYLGLKEFSARAGAANFTMDELKSALYYAHLHEVRVYLALNTLVRDGELSYIKRMAVNADKIGVDAFILQDPGLASYIRDYVEAPFHGSTQMTVINKEGAEVLAKAGFTRVVPARELSLSEIADIVNDRACQVEVFCHGAQCMSYSGQCMMSRFIGFTGTDERSGNRGSCAQPCRMKYTLLKRTEDSETIYSKGFRLSPSDLCSLSYLKELTDTGVDSLKIEGRLKRPEYAALVTSKYRKYLDMIRDGQTPENISDDLYDLTTQFSRGGFCEGHQKGKMPLSAITFYTPGHSGALCGKVLGKPFRVDSPVPLYKIKVALSGTLKKGDTVMFGFRGSDPDADVKGGNVNLIYVNDKKVLQASRGQVALLTISGDASGVAQDCKVFRTQDGALTEELSCLYRRKDTEHRRLAITASFRAYPGEKASLKFTDRFGNSSEAFSSCDCVVSTDKVELTKESVFAQISKLGNSPFTISEFTCDMAPSLFLPLSCLNEMRRDAASKLSEKKGVQGRL